MKEKVDKEIWLRQWCPHCGTVVEESRVDVNWKKLVSVVARGNPYFDNTWGIFKMRCSHCGQFFQMLL